MGSKNTENVRGSLRRTANGAQRKRGPQTQSVEIGLRINAVPDDVANSLPQ